MNNIKKLLFVACATVFGTSAFSEGPTLKTINALYGNWTLSCTETQNNKNCNLVQQIKNDAGQTVAVLSLTHTGETSTMEFALPHGMNLKEPMKASVDGQVISNYQYDTCNERACFIIARDDAKLMNSLSSGKTLSLEADLFSNRRLAMTAPLSGFEPAMAALKEK